MARKEYTECMARWVVLVTLLFSGMVVAACNLWVGADDLKAEGPCDKLGDIQCSENGKEALTIYNDASASIAAVIIDMTMPVLGGLPTMRELVRMNPDIRIIAASGIHDNEATARSIGGQVKQFLAKPFTKERLLRAVATAVAGS